MTLDRNHELFSHGFVHFAEVIVIVVERKSTWRISNTELFDPFRQEIISPLAPSRIISAYT